MTEADVRDLIASDPAIQLASSPSGTLENYLDVLRERIAIAYKAAGFPDVGVVAAMSPDRGQVVVGITEGPRLKWGSLVIHAPDGIDTAAIRTAMDRPKSDDVGLKVKTSKQGLTLNYGPREGERNEQRGDRDWRPGEPATFSDGGTWRMERRIEDELALQGYMSAEVSCTVVRNGPVADLDIRITPGPRLSIRTIRVTGLKRSSREELLAFLGLSEPMDWDRERITAIPGKMWSCGRFFHHAVSVTASRLDASNGTLEIDCYESTTVPKVSDPLSPELSMALKAADWLSLAPSRDEDISFHAQSTKPGDIELNMVLSFQQGFYVSLRGKSAFMNEKIGSEVFPTDHIGAEILATDQVFGMAFENGPAYVGPALRRSIDLTCTFLGTAPDAEGRARAYSVGGGIDSKRDPTGHVFRPVFAFAPVCLLDPGNDAKGTLKDGTLTIDDRETQYLFDSQTGRFRIRWNDDVLNAALTFEKGALRVRTDELLAKSRQNNRYRPEAPGTSFIAFVVESAIQQRVIGRRDLDDRQVAMAAAAVRKLLNSETLGLTQLDPFSDDHPAALSAGPMDVPESKQTWRAAWAMCLLGNIDSLFERESWPWTMSREVLLLGADLSRYQEMELERAGKTERTGPIYWLAMAECQRLWGSPDGAAEHVRRARGLVSKEEIAKDCSALLGRDAQMPLGRICRAVANLTPEEVDALAQLAPEQHRALAVRFCDSLRRGTAKPADALATAIFESGLLPLICDRIESAATKPR